MTLGFKVSHFVQLISTKKINRVIYYKLELELLIRNLKVITYNWTFIKIYIIYWYFINLLVYYFSGLI